MMRSELHWFSNLGRNINDSFNFSLFLLIKYLKEFMQKIDLLIQIIYIK